MIEHICTSCGVKRAFGENCPMCDEPQKTIIKERNKAMSEKIQWEYKTFIMDRSSTPFTAFDCDRLGKNGWEMCGVIEVDGRRQFYFKRPLEDNLE